MKTRFLYLIALCVTTSYAQGFLHAKDQRIVDAKGENIILRGLGLGGWMVQEGYMLQTGEFAGPQYVIRQNITDLIGDKNTDEFYDAYLANGITKRDIDSLKAWGFNSVRLPMHYNLYTLPIEAEQADGNTWLKKGFAMTDALLEWCAANEMYLILDLHAAPGGQGKDANISDYDTSKPSLWESDANQKKMIAFWEEIATRYKDNPWIGGYDIINEPNWNFTGTNPNGCDETSNAPLRKLMEDVTKAIRAIDTNHIIIVEGNCWGNNYSGIFPLWDTNMVVSFHKYWNHNTTASIQKMLDYRMEYNVPIWLGESGENSNVWFKDAIRLMETNNIGWAFWPMKKVENMAGVTSVTKNPDFEVVRTYWKDGGKQPTEAFAKKALMQLAENYKMEHLTIKTDVIDAMFRQVQTDATKAYKTHVIPGRLYATEYDLGSNGDAYSDVDFINYRVDTGVATTWNSGNKMRNDGVDIQETTDTPSNGYEVFDIQAEEWLRYTVNLVEAGTYDVQFRYSNPSAPGKLHLEFDSEPPSANIHLPTTANATTYQTVVLKNIALKKGATAFKVFFDTGGFHLNYLDFIKQ